MTLDENEKRAAERKLWDLPSDDPVRVAAEAVLAGQSRCESLRPLLDILKQPTDYRAGGPILATWVLGLLELSEQERHRVIPDLVRVMQVGVPLTSKGAVLDFGATALRTLFAFLGTRSTSPYSPYQYPGLATVAVPEGILSHVRTATALSLGRLGGTEALYALTGAATGKDAMLGRAARFALCLALPQLTHEHYGALGPGVEASLCSLLRYTDEQLSLHIVAAMGKVGGETALLAIRNIPGYAWTENLGRAIVEVEPAIELRVRQGAIRAELLRPTDAATAVQDQLLRPAAGSADQSSSNLLRPAEEETPPDAPM